MGVATNMIQAPRKAVMWVRNLEPGNVQDYPIGFTSAGVEFYKRNPLNFFLKSPSIFKRNPIKKNRLQFYMEIPLLFSKNHKLETIFEKSHRSSMILKIVGATPQLVQNLTPIKKFLVHFFIPMLLFPKTLSLTYPKTKNLKDQKWITF